MVSARLMLGNVRSTPVVSYKLRPIKASLGGRVLDDPLQLSKNIRCFSNMRMLPSSASSSDSAISERARVKRVLNDCTLASDLDREFGDLPVGLRKMRQTQPGLRLA